MLTLASMVDLLIERNPGQRINKLALNHGIDPQSLRMWRKGRGLPNEENCILLADAAGIDRRVALVSLAIERSQNKSDELNMAWREICLLVESKFDGLTS